jgi:hypothetical protein
VTRSHSRDLEKDSFVARLDAEVRELDPPEEKERSVTSFTISNLPLSLTTDSLSDRVLKAESKHREDPVVEDEIGE